jgi:hypothetical protein
LVVRCNALLGGAPPYVLSCLLYTR